MFYVGFTFGRLALKAFFWYNNKINKTKIMPDPNTQRTDDYDAPTLKMDAIEEDEIPFLDEAYFEEIVEEEEGEKTAEYYAKAPGIPVSFRRSGGRVIKGKLIEWDNPERFVVVGIDGNDLIKKEFTADKMHAWNPFLSNSIAMVSASADVRTKLTSVLEDFNVKKARAALEENREIIVNDNDWLEDEITTDAYIDENGNEEVSIALSTAKTPNYKKPKNEDSVGFNRRFNTSIVTDGMGGEGHGDKATEIVTRHMTSVPFEEAEIKKAAKKAADEIKAKNLGRAGACFAMTYTKDGDEIKIAEAGDCLVVVTDQNNNVLATSEDLRAKLGLPAQNWLEALNSDAFRAVAPPAEKLATNLIKQFQLPLDEAKTISERIHAGQKPVVKPEMESYKILLAPVMNTINAQKAEPLVYGTGIIAKPGMRVYKFTDGITDLDVLENILGATKGDKTPEEAIRIISAIAHDAQEQKGAKIDNMGVSVEYVVGAEAARAVA